MKIKSQNGICQLDIPNTYAYFEKESVISIHNSNGVGAISISSYSIPNNYDFLIVQELLDFAQSIDESVTLNETDVTSSNNCYCFTKFIDSAGKYWRIWVYYKSNYAAFATYNCDKADKNIERNEVDMIINSLKLGNV